MAGQRVKYDDQEKELWYKARRAGDSITKIAETFGAPIGTVSLNCKKAGVKKGGSVPAPEPQVESKEEEGAEDSFAELAAAFKGVGVAAVAFIQRRNQEILTQNAELTAELAEAKEECDKLREAVLEERNGDSDWKERLQSF